MIAFSDGRHATSLKSRPKPHPIHGHEAYPTAPRKLSGSVYLGVGSILVGVIGMVGGVLLWNEKSFLVGMFGGIALGVIAIVWGLIDCLIGAIRKRPKNPIPTQIPQPVLASSPPPVSGPNSPPVLAATTATAPLLEQPARRTGGWFAVTLGGGAIASILAIAFVIVAFIVGLSFIAFRLLMWLLENWGPHFRI